MIDVHILHLPNERADWWQECEASLSDHPITIHHVDGVVGDIRQARLSGYQLGHHEYVSYVDPDDIVMPGAFQALLDTLSSNPHVDGAYSLSDRIDHNGKSLGLIHPFREYTQDYLRRNILEIHQLTCMRRSSIINTIQDNYHLIPPMGYAEVTYCALFAQKYLWKAVDHVGYAWRMHNGGAHILDHGERLLCLEQLIRIRDSVLLLG